MTIEEDFERLFQRAREDMENGDVMSVPIYKVGATLYWAIGRDYFGRPSRCCIKRHVSADEAMQCAARRRLVLNEESIRCRKVETKQTKRIVSFYALPSESDHHTTEG